MMAAVRGIIDYSEAQLLDVSWWRRTRVLLNGMQRDSDLKLREAVYQYHLALVANSALDDESFKKVQGAAKDTFDDILEAYRPWDDEARSDRYKHGVSGAMEAYKRLIGDPDDPEYQRKILLDKIRADALQELEETTSSGRYDDIFDPAIVQDYEAEIAERDEKRQDQLRNAMLRRMERSNT